MDRIDEALAADATACSTAEYYGAPSEYPDCPMPDWLKRRLGLPPDERVVREAVEAMQAAAMGYRTAPTMEVVARGLADGADAADVLMAFSYLLAPRSRYQTMAGWVAGAYTPRQAVARAVEHGYKLRGLRDQLRCVRVRGFAAEQVFASWGSDPGEPIMKLPERARSLYLRELLYSRKAFILKDLHAVPWPQFPHRFPLYEPESTGPFETFSAFQL
ncbi:MAG: hypothetical protein OXG04_27365 [Acidobacteria bacterium]|nr:hypothetical protein [Acidobacteriota bacterium]